MINYKARMYLSYIAYHYYHNKLFPIREDITRSYRTGRSLKTLIINNYQNQIGRKLEEICLNVTIKNTS